MHFYFDIQIRILPKTNRIANVLFAYLIRTPAMSKEHSNFLISALLCIIFFIFCVFPFPFIFAFPFHGILLYFSLFLWPCLFAFAAIKHRKQIQQQQLFEWQSFKNCKILKLIRIPSGLCALFFMFDIYIFLRTLLESIVRPQRDADAAAAVIDLVPPLTLSSSSNHLTKYFYFVERTLKDFYN